MNIPRHAQVLIIGGGPAGSVAGMILAREGIDVVLCEKDKFPRYHIGESLIPSLLPILDFAGLREILDDYGFVIKRGANFDLIKGYQHARSDFSRGRKYKYCFQVIRSEFDKLLLDHAKNQGCKVFEETNVKNIKFEDKKPIAVEWSHSDGSSGVTTFDFLIDASGLRGFMSNTYLKNRHFQPAFANVALGSYWKNFADFIDESGKCYPGEFLMNAITDNSGWVWAIPLHDGTISIGVIVHESEYKRLTEQGLSNEDIYNSKIDKTWTLKRMLEKANRSAEIKLWNDYSYYADNFAGNNYRLAGDAAAFLDPLLSSGVHIATLGGLSSAATICSVIRNECPPDIAAEFHDQYIRVTYTRFLLLVTAIYQQIRSQDKLVLKGVSNDTIQSSFNTFVPMISGLMDINNGAEVESSAVSDLVNFLQECWVEKTAPGYTQNKKEYSQAELNMVSSTYTAEQGLAFSPELAFKGYYIRLERGNLGLQAVDEKK